MERLPLIGLERELRRLRRALELRGSLCLIGPAGCGKSRLLREAAAGSSSIIHLDMPRKPHDLLRALALRLNLNPDASSVHLRGLLWDAFEASPRTLMLDHVRAPGPSAHRFLERLVHTPGAAVIVAARSRNNLGPLQWLFWDPRNQILMKPVIKRDCRRLFAAAADHFGLTDLDLDSFQEQVLEAACGNTGQIVEMCRLAADPEYRSGSRIKFTLLRIDAIINLAG